MDTSDQQIKEYLDKLPPVVRSAVLADEWRKRLGQIAAKYSLHLDQISALEYETLFVLIGMEDEADFVGNIEKEIGVSKVLATELASEISERVFKYVLKLMESNTSQPKRFEPIPTPAPKITSVDLLSKMETVAHDIKPHEPKVAEPPANLPGMETSVEANTPIVSETPKPEPVQTPPVKSYTADPYREPLE